MGAIDALKSAVTAMDARVRPWSTRGPLHCAAYEFLLFGLKQGWSSLFGGLMLGLLVTTHYLYPDRTPVARYDVLVLAALAIQAALLWLKLETWEEAAVIFVFHVVGTCMELFKTAHGSWIYPEPSLLRVGGVPLFTGFMYGCVGSYMARAQRLFDIHFDRQVPAWAMWVLAIGAYANFFSDSYGFDFRWLLIAWSAVVFGRLSFWYRPDERFLKMPMLLGFVLVALFIWIAENLGTNAHAWIYPSQRDGWRMVSPIKMVSWYLLMMLSFVLVCAVRRPPISRDRPRVDEERFARFQPVHR